MKYEYVQIAEDTFDYLSFVKKFLKEVESYRYLSSYNIADAIVKEKLKDKGNNRYFRDFLKKDDKLLSIPEYDIVRDNYEYLIERVEMILGSKEVPIFRSRFFVLGWNGRDTRGKPIDYDLMEELEGYVRGCGDTTNIIDLDKKCSSNNNNHMKNGFDCYVKVVKEIDHTPTDITSVVFAELRDNLLYDLQGVDSEFKCWSSTEINIEDIKSESDSINN